MAGGAREGRAGGGFPGGSSGGAGGGSDRSIRLRRRDGALVAYDAERVREGGASRRPRQPTRPAFAAEVEEVVRMALVARSAGAVKAAEVGRGVWELDALVDLVEQALIEMGSSRVAKAFIVLRDRREQARAALSIVQEEPRGANERRLRWCAMPKAPPNGTPAASPRP